MGRLGKKLIHSMHSAWHLLNNQCVYDSCMCRRVSPASASERPKFRDRKRCFSLRYYEMFGVQMSEDVGLLNLSRILLMSKGRVASRLCNRSSTIISLRFKDSCFVCETAEYVSVEISRRKRNSL